MNNVKLISELLFGFLCGLSTLLGVILILLRRLFLSFSLAGFGYFRRLSSLFLLSSLGYLLLGVIRLILELLCVLISGVLVSVRLYLKTYLVELFRRFLRELMLALLFLACIDV